MATVSSKTTNAYKPPNTARVYRVKRADLPLHCPLPEMSLWNSHPRVYLPIEETGQAKCPYCSADFILED
ncbi:MAG TPA: zinc-finger domain-containing protein [Gammaproteobacteria bacterium]|nr:zinc-finger domain-containing protein [Gammaproteobacteria bacterium]